MRRKIEVIKMIATGETPQELELTQRALLVEMLVDIRDLMSNIRDVLISTKKIHESTLPSYLREK